MLAIRPIAPCLWFNDQAEAAVKFYTSVFRDSKILQVQRYPDEGKEVHGRPPGSVMAISFELNGQKFTALNGGPVDFKFSEAISLEIHCQTQEEVDYYWERLAEGGDPKAQQCGWLKDRYGISWQIIPIEMNELFADHLSAQARGAMRAMLTMKKLDLAAMQKAAEDEAARAGPPPSAPPTSQSAPRRA